MCVHVQEKHMEQIEQIIELGCCRMYATKLSQGARSNQNTATPWSDTPSHKPIPVDTISSLARPHLPTVVTLHVSDTAPVDEHRRHMRVLERVTA